MRGLSLLDVAFLPRTTPITDWAARVVANGGAMPSTPTINAMETFRLAMISAGLDTKMHALCVFVPDSLIAATTPLFVGIGSDPWTNHNFVGGDVSVDGLKGDGASKYLDTGVQCTSGQAVAAGTGNCGLSLIISDTATNAAACEIGRRDNSNNTTPTLVLQVSGADGGTFSSFSTAGTDITNRTSIKDGSRCGFVSANSVGGTLNVYVGGPQITLYSSTSKAVATQTTSNTDTLTCFALRTTTGSVVDNFSAKRLSVAAIHQGLSSGDAATLMSLMMTLRSSLGGGTGDPGTAWSYRVVANGGAAPSGGSVSACNTFVSAINTAGIIPKIGDVNPFAPDSLTACRVPLFAPSGSQIWTNNNFVGGDLTVDGLIGNGSTKYLQTGIVPSSSNQLSATNAGASVMVFSTTNLATRVDMGNWNAGTQAFGFERISGTTAYIFCWGTSSASDFLNPALPSSTWPGFITFSRTASNALAYYIASTSNSFALLASTAAAQNQTTLTPIEFYAFAFNKLGTGPSDFSASRLSFLAVHNGLNSTESQALYNAVAAMRTTFGGGNP